MADIALFSRLIFLSFSKSTFSEEEKREYQILKKMRVQGMSHLTLEILKLRNKIEADFPTIYQRTMDDVTESLTDLVIEDRIMLNWVAPLAVPAMAPTQAVPVTDAVSIMTFLIVASST